MFESGVTSCRLCRHYCLSFCCAHAAHTRQARSLKHSESLLSMSWDRACLYPDGTDLKVDSQKDQHHVLVFRWWSVLFKEIWPVKQIGRSVFLCRHQDCLVYIVSILPESMLVVTMCRYLHTTKHEVICRVKTCDNVSQVDTTWQLQVVLYCDNSMVDGFVKKTRLPLSWFHECICHYYEILSLFVCSIPL